MLRSLTNLNRLMRAGRILAQHDALIPHEYKAQVPASLRAGAWIVFGGAKKSYADLQPGERLALAFQQIGPSAIKLGQLLATRPDILGPDVTRGLEALQDRLPPFPDEQARAAIAADLGKPIAEFFAELGPPVAAASIAQVHKAVTAGAASMQVAVKVLRPGIENEFARDFDAFRFAAAARGKILCRSAAAAA